MIKMMKNIICVIVAGMLLTFSVSALNPQKPDEITVYNFDQFRHWLHKANDSIYVVNFWATWCAPCIKEIPDFEKLHAQYNSDKVKVLFVSLDFPGQLESRVIPFIERMNMNAQVVLLNDPNSNRWIPQVNERWSGAIPATLIYGNGFREFYEKEFTFEELEEIILTLIN